MSETLLRIPAIEGVRKVAAQEGERFDIASVHLTWKVKGEDSGYAFSVCEQTLEPGEGVPLHSHSSPEAFYILTGQIDFLRITSGKEDWIRCEPGSTIILPPNSLHAFYNRSPGLCRVLGISTQLHQTFFDAVASTNKVQPFSAMPFREVMERVARIGLRHNMYFASTDLQE